MIKKFFLSRKQWEMYTEKLLKDQSKELQGYWSKILEQRVLKVKESITIEKDSEIKILKKELKERQVENTELKNSDLQIEKFKNQLRSKIEHLDYQSKLLAEVQSRISIQLGMNDSLIKDSEKLLRKEV